MLATNPSNEKHTILTRDKFKITHFLRCNLAVSNLLLKCDGHGQYFIIEHVLYHKKRGLTTARYDHLKYKLANLLGEVLPQSYIKIEPTFPRSSDANNNNRLVGDVSAKKL